MSTATLPPCTADDLLTMQDGDQYELVNGHLVELEMSATSSWVAGETHRRLANYAQESRTGWAFPEGTSYQCFPWDPGRVRRADASFIRMGRFLNDEIPEVGHLSIPPDLAAEVVSPHDSHSDVDQKVEDFLEAGVHLVWVINPQTQSVHVYRPGAQGASRLSIDDELSGEDVLPGFQCRVADLFPQRASTAGVESRSP